MGAVRPGLQRGNGIGEGTSKIIVTVKLDTHLWIAFSAETHELFNLARCGNTNRIWQTDALNACLDDGIKDGQQIHQVAAKCILPGKTHLAPDRTTAPVHRNAST